MHLRAVVVVLLLLLAGCYVVPPLRVSAGGAQTVGTVTVRNPRDERRTADDTQLAELRAGIAPMSMLRDPVRRRGDFVLGYTFDWARVRDGGVSPLHGPYAEVTWFARRSTPELPVHWRWGPSLAGELFDGEDGYGMSAGILLELVDAVGGRGAGVSPWGAGYGGSLGELAIGVSARAGVRHVDDARHGYVMLSIEARLPGMAGVAIGVTRSRFD